MEKKIGSLGGHPKYHLIYQNSLHLHLQFLVRLNKICLRHLHHLDAENRKLHHPHPRHHHHHLPPIKEDTTEVGPKVQKEEKGRNTSLK
jgi:hypothetical protein